MTDVNKKIAKGAAWMILFKVAGQLLGIVSTVILARLLAPTEFGIVAMAMSVIAVLELMRNFSFDAMLIQKRDAQPYHYDTAWTFNVLLGLLVAALLIALAGPTATFYDEPRLTDIMYVLAAGTALQGFENIGVVSFRKEMRFDREFRFLMLRRVAGFVVTIPAAFILKSYWALVLGMLAMRVTSVTASYVMSSYRPRFSMAGRRELFGFSIWLFVLNVLEFTWVRSADFIIGKIAGARMLGIFSISYQLSNLPTTELVAPVNRAVFPGYALVSGDRWQLRQGYLNVLSIISLLTVPVGTGIAVVAPLLVAVLLGPEWVEAGPVMAVLSFFGVTSALLANSGSIFKAIGKPKYLTIITGVRIVFLIPALIYATRAAGVLGAAYAYLAVSLLFMPVYYALLCRVLDLSLADLAGAVGRPVLAATAMYFVVAGFLSASAGAFEALPAIVALLAAAAIGALVYPLVLLGLWSAFGRPPGAEQMLLDRIRKRTTTDQTPAAR